MLLNQTIKELLILKTIDCSALSLSFILASLLLSQPTRLELLIHAVFFSSVILISVYLARHLLPLKLSSTNRVIRLNLINAAGLIIGTSFLLVLGQLFSLSNGVTIVIASTLAFFTLGTLSPLIMQKKRLPYQQDIV
jgi:hypothetical protein